ncbi:MAG: peptidase MA family metallohydrolase, partial [Acidobacteria bacterium]|nr:peptidase MA family metallohydrolase [Acidobacteriota bacterium]MDW7985232.1 peptidase MA family metallohydrolase [Acidobacteriota bacterium]
VWGSVALWHRCIGATERRRVGESKHSYAYALIPRCPSASVHFNGATEGVSLAAIDGDRPVGWIPTARFAYQPCLQVNRGEARPLTSLDGRPARRPDLRNFLYLETAHFILYYHPSLRPAILASIQHALETAYREVTQYIGIAFDKPIVVFLYTEAAYEAERIHRQVPPWGGALYDGRVHLPIPNGRPITSMTLRRLRHELCHAVLDRYTLGQAPLWLQEGIAYGCEYMDDPAFLENAFQTSLSRRAVPSAGVLRRSDYVPLGEQGVRDVYAAAYQWVQALIEQYGRDPFDRWLDHMARGRPWETAFRDVYGDDFSTLYEAWRAGLYEHE